MVDCWSRQPARLAYEFNRLPVFGCRLRESMILPDDLPYSVTPPSNRPSGETADRTSSAATPSRRRSEPLSGDHGRARAARRERAEPAALRDEGGEPQTGWLGFRQSVSAPRAQGQNSSGASEVGGRARGQT